MCSGCVRVEVLSHFPDSFSSRTVVTSLVSPTSGYQFSVSPPYLYNMYVAPRDKNKSEKNRPELWGETWTKKRRAIDPSKRAHFHRKSTIRRKRCYSLRSAMRATTLRRASAPSTIAPCVAASPSSSPPPSSGKKSGRTAAIATSQPLALARIRLGGGSSGALSVSSDQHPQCVATCPVSVPGLLREHHFDACRVLFFALPSQCRPPYSNAR